MKLVVAIIKPFKVDDVRKALAAIALPGLTISEAKGYGRQKGQIEVYRGAEYAVNFLPKMRLEVIVDNDMVDKVIETIRQAAHTGKVGDGKIMLIDLARVIRIRTGEEGQEAI